MDIAVCKSLAKRVSRTVSHRIDVEENVLVELLCVMGHVLGTKALHMKLMRRLLRSCLRTARIHDRQFANDRRRCGLLATLVGRTRQEEGKES